MPKQFLPVAGVPLLLRALRPFLAHPAVREVIAVLPAQAAAAPPGWLADLVGERLQVTAGGPTRTASSALGVARLSPACGIVLVHDGARPFPRAEVIEAVIETARRGSGAIAAVPLSDTLKAAEPASAIVSRTIPRDGLWRAQTPQGFPRRLLEDANRRAEYDGWAGTDEAELIERYGGQVVLIRDSVTNLKVTTDDDLRLAEAFARDDQSPVPSH